VRVDVRMGLHTGLVVVGAIGDNLRMDYTAVGDTTHLAARLQQRAEEGAILVSEATARFVEGYVRLEPLGPVPLPWRLLEILGERTPVSRCLPVRS
jgi:class 3 adenylate cyclase